MTIKNLSAGYGKIRVLHDISMSAKSGEFIALVGPNGAGKSCLLKAIAGIISPSQGALTFKAQPLAAMSPKARAKNIAYLAQERTASWSLPVHELVRLGRAPYRGPLGRLSTAGEAAVLRAMQAADCVDLKDRRFDQLSGGEQARVHLARALSVEAHVLLADEPAAALDPFYQHTIMQTLSDQAANGKIVIASMHDLRIAQQYCSRIWVLHHGNLVQNAAPSAALSAAVLANVFQVKRSKNGYAPLLPSA